MLGASADPRRRGSVSVPHGTGGRGVLYTLHCHEFTRIVAATVGVQQLLYGSVLYLLTQVVHTGDQSSQK